MQEGKKSLDRFSFWLVAVRLRRSSQRREALESQRSA